MATVYTYQKSGSHQIRRCDAKCHTAKGPNCNCVCRGINHGVGNNQAIVNTQVTANILSVAQEAGEFIINRAQYKFFEGGKP